MDACPTSSDLTTLSLQIGAQLSAYNMLLATAESCTGGWVAQAITATPGSSAWFERGFVTYSDAAKRDLLAVQQQTLLEHGAVSQETALAMAQGALLRSLAHISVAITGIAGPDGGSPEKPIGTVWIGWAAKGAGAVAQRFQFVGDRNAIRLQAVHAALNGIFSILSSASSSTLLPPVITLDGPSGTGKGTLSHLLAKHLGWHYLDSGALFRILAYAAMQHGIDAEDATALQALARTLDVKFVENTDAKLQVLLADADITEAIRSEECGNMASKIAVLALVRQALLERQQAFRQWPGLVTDGRDMGTIIFPDATCKFFLHASLEERAKRRFAQLKKKGVHAKLDAILPDLQERDNRDRERSIAPLQPAADALPVDTSSLSIEASFSELMQHINSTFLSMTGKRGL